jgi:hypothetical protein
MLTARAITKARVSKATVACTSISIFAHRERAMTSVGLNAVALVNDKLQIVNVSGLPIGRCQGRAESFVGTGNPDKEAETYHDQQGRPGPITGKREITASSQSRPPVESSASKSRYGERACFGIRRSRSPWPGWL